MSEHPPFVVSEYEARLARTRAAMERRGIDLLLVTSEANFRWLTGFTSQVWVMPTRPRFFLLPIVGEAVAVVPTSNVIEMQQSSWVRDVRTWTAPRPADDGVSLVRGAILSFNARTV